MENFPSRVLTLTAGKNSAFMLKMALQDAGIGWDRLKQMLDVEPAMEFCNNNEEVFVFMTAEWFLFENPVARDWATELNKAKRVCLVGVTKGEAWEIPSIADIDSDLIVKALNKIAADRKKSAA